MSAENSSIGGRLKSERLRLSMSQEDFALKAKASRRALIEWEKTNTYPDANQLHELAGIGVDIGYVITGRRVADSLYANGTDRVLAANEPRTSDREAKLLSAFRDLDESGRKAIEQMATALKAAKGA
jgi:transcriptional regulator with XRE-family HTH domain